jgi:diguanylate cyclase (GGDEF)-like protein/PAS domain S-box-containing protein
LARSRRTGSKRSVAASRAALTGLLLDLSSDWYWEQDAELRFTRVEVRNPAERALAATLMGKQRWDTGVEIEGGWEAHRATLAAHASFRDVLMWRRLPDGRRRYMSVSGEPTYDARGRFTGYRGIGRDITKQKRMQQLLKLQQAVTACLAETASVPQALSSALRSICETEAWDCAEYWRYDESDGGLRRFVHWSRENDAEAARFVAASGGLLVKPGSGLVGTVWQTGELMWLADSSEDPRGLRKTLAEQSGLRGTALLPVRHAGTVVGVIAFQCRRARPADKRLIQTLNAIVTQVGEFLGRVQAELATRESEARFRSLTNLSSDWFWEQDAEYRFTRLEGRQVAGGDQALRTRLIGTRRWEGELEIEGGWDAHRALLERREPFYNALMWRTMADGRLRYMTVSGEPMLDAEGAFTGYRGVGRDVTADKRAEQLLKLEHRVAGLLGSASDVASGLQAVIRAVCEAEGWACGRAFRVDEAAGKLVFHEGWSVADPAFERFVADSRARTYELGEGLAGRVWQDSSPLWTADVRRDPRVHPGTIGQATQIGIHGVFALPVVAEGKVIGVLSFSSARVREPDARLLETSRVIGSQVGQFLQRAQAEESLRESEARFRSLTQMSSDFFWESDPHYRVVQLVHGPNYSSAHMGRGVLGKAPWELPSLRPDEVGWNAHRALVEQRLPFRDFEFARGLPDGVRHFSISGEPRFSPEGEFVGYRGVGRDVTEIAVARERIASLAYSDPLTGLANRTSLGPSLDQAVQRARRRRGKLAVVFVDLDGFKQINDVHGHAAGDALLVEVAGRLREHLRASDFVARLGGDEFLVVLEEVTDAAQVEIVARKVLGEMMKPYAIDGTQAHVTASVGISIYPDDASDALALMKHADTAMYAAKQAGKNTFRLYTAGAAANEAAASRKDSAA